jgi:hypothetical protein
LSPRLSEGLYDLRDPMRSLPHPLLLRRQTWELAEGWGGQGHCGSHENHEKDQAANRCRAGGDRASAARMALRQGLLSPRGSLDPPETQLWKTSLLTWVIHRMIQSVTEF